MSRRENVTPSSTIRGLVPGHDVDLLSVRWHGGDTLEVNYRTDEGELGSQLLYRANETRLELASSWATRCTPRGDGRLR